MTRWLHIIFGGCKDHDPAEWCNGCFYRAWNKLHPDQARTSYDPKLRPLARRTP